jgi:hypothetical protein
MNKPRWSAYQKQRLRTLRHQGVTYKRCAELLGKSLAAVKLYCLRHDIKPQSQLYPDAYYEGMAAHPERPVPTYQAGTQDHAWYCAGWNDAAMEVAA